jgi:hypothetical protein
MTTIIACGALVLDNDGNKKWLRYKITNMRAARKMYYLIMARNKKMLLFQVYDDSGNAYSYRFY